MGHGLMKTTPATRASSATAKSLRFFYETRNLPTDATVVVTIAAPVLVKGAHLRFSEPERFAAWTNFAATYKPDLSDSSRYLGPPETGRLAKPIPLARNGKRWPKSSATSRTTF